MSYWNFLFINISIVGGENYNFFIEPRMLRSKKRSKIRKRVKAARRRQNPFNKLHFPVLMLLTLMKQIEQFELNSSNIILKEVGGEK